MKYYLMSAWYRGKFYTFPVYADDKKTAMRIVRESAPRFSDPRIVGEFYERLPETSRETRCAVVGGILAALLIALPLIILI